MYNKKLWTVLLAVSLCMMPAIARAGDAPVVSDSGEMQKMIAGMTKEMSQLKQLVESQNKKIEYLEQKTADAVKISQGSVAPAQATPMGEKEFQEMLTNEMGKDYKYFKNLKMGGDFRLRMESFREQDTRATSAADGMEDRNRFRYRLRYGIENKVGNDMTVGFRLATAGLKANAAASGATDVYAADPTSTNQTMGSPGLFSFNTIAIEKAYAKYTPKLLQDVKIGPTTLKSVEIGGGKFDNPFAKVTSPMVWDGDVTPEGLYEKFDWNLYSNEGNEVNFFGHAMQSPLKESVNGDEDVSLYAFGGGLNMVGYTPLSAKPVELTSAMNAYVYRMYGDATGTTGNYTLGASSLARGNTTCVGTAGAGPCSGMEMGDPRVLQFYNELKLTPMGKTPLKLFSDVATNVNNGSVSGASARKSTAFGLGTALGELKNPKDWQLSYAYYQVPPNAVVGAFADSDFGQGHSNNRGSVVKMGYQLTKALQLNLAWFQVSPYDGNLATGDNKILGDHTTNRFQTDLVWKF